MTVDERNVIIEWLLMWSMWSREALENMGTRKLLEEYDRHNKLSNR